MTNDQATPPSSPPPKSFARQAWPAALAGAALLLGLALTLHGMGRPWWCKCAGWNPWAGNIWSMHNSQHLFDPYSFTHLLHGFGFYALLALALGRWLGRHWRMALMVGLESAWEIAENSSFVIEKYRAATISLDYYGDSVINSVSDVLCCSAGYLLAGSLPVWASAAVFCGLELVLALWIRDGLILNLIMLISPVESIKAWQMGGAP